MQPKMYLPLFQNLNLNVGMHQKFVDDTEWKETGQLEEHGAFVIHTSLSMTVHLNVVCVALKKDFYKALAHFIAAHKAPLLPYANITKAISRIIQNSRTILMDLCNYSADKQPWKNLESSGLLLQFLHCSTSPQPLKILLYIHVIMT